MSTTTTYVLVSDEIERFNNYDNSIARVEYQEEYLTLLIDEEVITQGEIEVYERIKQINHELGYNWL